MINRSSSQCSSRVLIHTPVSFSTDSGGRTKAVFQRAAGLATRWPLQWLLTLNHRVEYREIFEAWARRTELPTGACMRNFFEDIAGEEIYLSSGLSHKFEASAVADPSDDTTLWQRVQGECKEKYKLRPDGSLAWKKTIYMGEYVGLDRFDRCNNLRVREVRKGSEILHTEYFSSTEQRFARVTPSPWEKNATILVDGGAFSTDGDEVPLVDVQKMWAAVLVEEAGRAPVVLLDHRAADKLFIDNPSITGKLTTIAVIHSTHIKAPYDDVEAIRPYNGSAIAHSERYSAITFLTDQQLADARRVYPVSNGVVIPHAALKPSTKLGTTKTAQRFVMVTRLIELKQVDHAIRAFARVLRQHPAAELEIWGNGEQEPALRALVRKLGIEKHVRFMGWTSNVSKVLHEATASIAVSQTEGFSLSILEALAHGLPVVAYRFRYGPSTMIRDGVNGYLVSRGDVEELADAMTKLLDHPWRTKIFGVVATASRIRYSQRRVRRAWEDLIQGADLAPEPGGGRRWLTGT